MSVYEQGEPAERLVESLFRRHQWKTTPARHHRSDGSGAPMLRNDGDPIRMPDIHVAGHGVSLWAEVKQKEEIEHTRVRSQDEHGIDTPAWKDYRRLADDSGLPVWIFIFEEDTGDLLAGDVAALPTYPPIDETRCIEHYGNLMTYIPRQSLTQIRVLPSHTPDDPSISPTMNEGRLLPQVINSGGDD